MDTASSSVVGWVVQIIARVLGRNSFDACWSLLVNVLATVEPLWLKRLGKEHRLQDDLLLPYLQKRIHHDGPGKSREIPNRDTTACQASVPSFDSQVQEHASSSPIAILVSRSSGHSSISLHDLLGTRKCSIR